MKHTFILLLFLSNVLAFQAWAQCPPNTQPYIKKSAVNGSTIFYKGCVRVEKNTQIIVGELLITHLDGLFGYVDVQHWLLPKEVWDNLDVTQNKIYYNLNFDNNGKRNGKIAANQKSHNIFTPFFVGYYTNNLPDKTWTFYNLSSPGAILSKVIFNNGRLISKKYYYLDGSLQKIILFATNTKNDMSSTICLDYEKKKTTITSGKKSIDYKWPSNNLETSDDIERILMNILSLEENFFIKIKDNFTGPYYSEYDQKMATLWGSSIIIELAVSGKKITSDNVVQTLSKLL